MNLSFLSPLVFGLGLAGLAGALYLLQRLRVRHREVEVVTTLFWHEAVHETRARVLVQRFRHPWAYALILAIAALLWVAVAGPRQAAGEGRDYVCLLDTSAGMARGDRFARARNALVERVNDLPRSRRRVIASGAWRQALLLPGEEVSLLEERLRGVTPGAAPSSIERELELLATASAGETSVLVFGGHALDAGFEASLPEGLELELVALEEPEAATEANAGICALGVSPASSGAWDAVDVFVELRGDLGDEIAGLAAQLDGLSEGLRPELQGDDGSERRLIFRDLPASGGLFSVSLRSGDALELDDRAELRLPNRPLLRVAVEPALLGLLGPALEADPAVLLVDTSPDIAVGEVAGAQVPSLRFVGAAEQDESFLVTFDEERSAEVALHEALGSLGLAEIDSAGLAQSAKVPITLGVRSGARREIAVWSELLGEDFDFRASRSFPLFVARALRWLSDTEPITPWIAVAEELGAVGAFGDDSGHRYDALGLPFAPPLAGAYVSDDGALVHASLLSTESTLPAVLDLGAAAELAAPSTERNLVTWLLLAALLLLIWEWALVRAERIP